ncbi:Hypp4534 [Branchiostoma lanceolatum]|uniref:Hypp4534 protein n=1 Tax=Branchiostoma lanceolatum TaxID=7740 RepID=A0A8K0AAC5_BRALA|nr:Hypp4534 [Branchiostoma lanceolatum]
MVQKIQKATYPVNASLSGDKFTFKYEFMGIKLETTFTLGVEGEEDDSTVGGKRRVIYTIEGDHLVAVYPNRDGLGTSMRMSSHFVDDDTIHSDVQFGDLVGWIVSKRC